MTLKGKIIPAVLLAAALLLFSSCIGGSGGNDGHFKVRPGQVELFEAGIKNKTPMMVEYTSPGCGACRVLAPTLAELEGEWKDKVTFVYFNISDSKYREMAAKAEIRAIPAMHFYKDGKKVGQLVGSMPKAEIEKELNKLIK